MTTPTREDYIREIGKLEEKIGSNVKSKDIASQMNLAKSTVSERLRDLANEKLTITEKYATIKLTKKGRLLAKKLTYKHRIIEVFLYDYLKVSKSKIHDEAHRLEHAFSDQTIKKLDKFLGYPKKDPHGSLIKKIQK